MTSQSCNSRKTRYKRKRNLGMRRTLSPTHCLLLVIFFLLSGHQQPAIQCLQPTFFVSAAIPVNLNRINQKEDTDSKLVKSMKTSVRKQASPAKLSDIAAPKKLTLNQILVKAGKRGLGGGIPGAIAGAVQVITLMWMRTIINYQYRYGTTFNGAFRTLFKEGGIPRFYRGLWFALVQAPLARFASTAANDGIESLLASFEATKEWGPGRGTFLASIAVGLFRIFLMPIDTCKVVLQVDSAEGLRNLMRKVRGGKITLLYSGALAQATSAIIAHYPWFYTYNTLNKNNFVQKLIKSPLLRNAGIGFIASVVSDTIANSIRVVKTTKQAIASKHSHSLGYMDAISMILAADGWKGLFGRGLKSRIIANGIQSVIFTVIWRGLAQRFSNDKSDESSEDERKVGDKAFDEDHIPSDEDYLDDIDSYD